MITAYACLGVLFAAPAAANAFSKGRPQSMREAVSADRQGRGYGEGLALVDAGGGSDYGERRGRRLVSAGTGCAGRRRVAGLVGIHRAGLLAGWMTLRFSAGCGAIWACGLVFMGLLLLFLLEGSRLPEIPLRGVELSVALSALMVILLRREVHPR